MPIPKCVDCIAWSRSTGKPAPKRSANNPGPRCASHYKQVQRARKARAHETRVVNEYGLKPGQYDRIYTFQGQVCAICRRATGASRRLSVDHDHRTGYVRGLLCRPCNDLLGHLRDDPRAATRINEYLGNPPAQFIGIWALHKSFREEESGPGSEGGVGSSTPLG